MNPSKTILKELRLSTVSLSLLLACTICLVTARLSADLVSHSSRSVTESGRASQSCFQGCICSLARQPNTGTSSFSSGDAPIAIPRWIVRCHRPRLFTSVEDILDGTIGHTLPSDILQLDLSGNAIVQLKNDSFTSFTSIEKLNLDNNRIEVIYDDAFAVLDNLKFLNLSDNNLRTLRNSSFVGLGKLEKLILSGNHLMRLTEQVVGPLTGLKFLDLARNPLICDCHLHWIVNWTSTYKIQLSRRSTCVFPTPLQGLRIHKLNKNQWHCNWPLQVPAFELQPSAPQIVFAGDSLNFTCRVSNIESSGRLHWLLDDTLIESNSNWSSIEALVVRMSPTGDLIVGSISVSSLTPAHQGTWSCVFETDRGNLSQSVNVRVVSLDGANCSPSISLNNKGRYEWPQALPGVTVELPCGSPLPIPLPARKFAWARRLCDETGQWQALDTSECPFVSEVTKVLEQFSKTDLSIARASVIENMQRLKNYTGDGSMLLDKMDLVFITRTIYKYLEFVPKHKEIGELLVDLVAMIMQLDKDLLAEAQLEDRSCSRLIEAVERLSEMTSEGIIRRHLDNIAVEDFIVKVESFSGISCASYVRGGRSGLLRSSYRRSDLTVYRRLYRCKVGSRGLPPDDGIEEILETSIRLPASLFQHHALYPMSVSHKLQFTFYHDASLFPRPPARLDHMDVVSSVVGSHLAKYLLANLTDPVTITLRTPIVSGKIIPVWWDFEANGKQGDWSPTGCKIRGIYGNLVSFDCNRLANFGLLQDTDQLALLRARSLKGAKFRPSHPVIYLGTAVAVFCLAWAIITYVLGFYVIRVTKKNKHALMNLWFSLIMIGLTFALAVRHTEDSIICQGVGLVLHYLSLVVLFWFLILASNILKKLTRLELLDFPVDDEPPLDRPPSPKPMLRFYLVGWGIPIIVCGISGAVNLVEYAGHDYCFLAVSHSVGTFYGPCGVIVMLICIYYLLIYCAICRTGDCEKMPEIDNHGYENGTNMELVNMGSEVDRDNLHTLEHRTMSANDSLDDGGCVNSSKDDEEEMEDNVHSSSTQLRAQALLLFLYLSSWACAAISTAEPFPPSTIPGSVTEVVFGSLFALLFTCLSTFIVIFHCTSRPDAGDVWRSISGKQQSLNRRNRQTSDQLNLPSSQLIVPAENCSNMDRQQQQLQQEQQQQQQQQQQQRSDGSLDSCCFEDHNSLPGARSYSSKFCNLNVGETLGTLGGGMVQAGGGGAITDTSWSGEMFYNPYQNGVARKFFRKHSKRNVHPQAHHPRPKLTNEDGYSNDLGFLGIRQRRIGDDDFVDHVNQLAPYIPPPSVNLNLPTGPKKLVDKASRVMSTINSDRDDVGTAIVVSSSSQGLVSPISPLNQSGNCSDRSLLIVEEEEDDDDYDISIRPGSNCDVENVDVCGTRGSNLSSSLKDSPQTLVEMRNKSTSPACSNLSLSSPQYQFDDGDAMDCSGNVNSKAEDDDAEQQISRKKEYASDFDNADHELDDHDSIERELVTAEDRLYSNKTDADVEECNSSEVVCSDDQKHREKEQPTDDNIIDSNNGHKFKLETAV